MSERSDRDPQQAMEQIVGLARGQKGDKGDTGAAGATGPGMTPGTRYAVIFLFLLGLAIGGLNLLFTSSEVDHLRHAVLTQCKFDADLGSAPIAVSPSSGKPSLLGVTIVSDSRVAWHGLGCPGKLAPPSPSFAKWAKAFHLPVG